MKPTEAQIEKACTDMLEADGWRTIETDLKRLRGLGVQEKGMADRLYVRYRPHPYEIHRDGRDNPRAIGWWQAVLPCQAEVLFIEWKRIREGHKAATKPSQHQLAWHAKERARGALTLIAGIDFEASIEGFIRWYRESGLMRRNIR
ncbi:MAG TPA: hypothetical protein VJQ59_16875 [Candidatus Sulfotelmatobacter sp.]|nr:hypothetical protein [Candidatus Sulfotelmatobacter sp.]